MASVNKVILIGNLGKDPELRYNPSGVAFCTVALATSRNWKNRETGERQEETEWHRVIFNDKLAEIVGQYCKWQADLRRGPAENAQMAGQGRP